MDDHARSAQPKRSPATRVPLFQRVFLRDADPREGYLLPAPDPLLSPRMQAVNRLYESIAFELSRMLNTRWHQAAHAESPEFRSVMDFGLPDLSGLNPGSERDRQRIGRLVVETVTAFEPRLHNPTAEVERDPASPRALRLKLRAKLLVENLLEPVVFPMLIEQKGGRVSVAQE